VYLILGSLVALTGLGLFARSDAARWAAVFFVSLNAIAQIVWFPAAPLWAGSALAAGRPAAAGIG
jgi:hypothetical protein